MDFDFITRRVATGSAIQSPADVDRLIAAGITHVIDCCIDFDDGPLLANRPGIAYLYNGVSDDGQPKPVAWFQRSVEFALPALATPRCKIYAHCVSGVNRGPSTAYAIVRALGIGPAEARQMLASARPQAVARYTPDADRAIAQLGYE